MEKKNELWLSGFRISSVFNRDSALVMTKSVMITKKERKLIDKKAELKRITLITFRRVEDSFIHIYLKWRWNC